MFAFAIWNENDKTLFLARDRVGIKPLYYCLTGNSLVFASEIKAILADPSIEREIAPEMIDRFLTSSTFRGKRLCSKGSASCPRDTICSSRTASRQCGNTGILSLLNLPGA